MPTPKPALVTLVLLAACLDPQPLDDKSDTDDSGSTGSGATVFEVNDGTVPEDTVVTLEGLVVTSPITRDGEGFFVADPSGGPNSGLFVWRQLGMDGLAVAEGDEVRITGTPNEFYGWMEFVIGAVDAVEVTGEATVPAPVELGDGAGVDWTEYESVVVSLDSQTVTSIDGFNTGTLSGGVKLDDGFQYLDYDCRGAFASVSGVVFYSYETHSINPRRDSDLGAYTAPTAEAGTIASVQSGDVCGPVRIENVVVTAPSVEDDGSTTFFVQDAGGGLASGVAVYVPDEVLTVAVGDVYTITGSAEEYYDFTQLRVTDSATNLAMTGTGTPLAEALSAAPDDWEPYEGMLITLADVTIESDYDADEAYGEVETNYGVNIDSLYYEHSLMTGQTFASITGVLYYNYEEWKLVPRDASDLVAP